MFFDADYIDGVGMYKASLCFKRNAYRIIKQHLKPLPPHHSDGGIRGAVSGRVL